jgi:uncharacterized protein YjbI with pentapeptide repeats
MQGSHGIYGDFANSTFYGADLNCLNVTSIKFTNAKLNGAEMPTAWKTP